MIAELAYGVGKGRSGELAPGAAISNANSELAYHVPGQLNWKNFQPEILLNYAAAVNSGQADTVSSFGSLSGTIKWATGILAPNGKIFCCPVNSNFVLVIDTKDDTTVQFTAPQGSLDSQYYCGVLADNGYIYMIPSAATAIARLDPAISSTLGTKTFGNLGAADVKWLSAAVAPNGKIYCPPYNETSILVIDPSGDTYYKFGSFTGGTAKWRTSSLAPNGKIYCMPTGVNTGDRVLVIDPSNDSYYFLKSPAGLYHVGATLYTDGCIYGSPFTSSTGIMKIDPEFDNVTKPISFASASYDCYHMSLLPNGKFYGRQNGQAGIFRFDPRTLSHDKTITDAGTTSKSNSNVLTQNGQIYCIPSSSTAVLKIGTPWAIDANWPLSAEFNKG